MNSYKLRTILVLLTILTVVATIDGFSQITRNDIQDKYKWNLTDLFQSDEAWRNALNDITSQLDEVEKYKGTLTQSASNLLKAL